MRFGSLFTGIGGMDLGLERAGMTCAWQVEIDPYCRAVLEQHWPDVPRWDDVKTFPPEPTVEQVGTAGQPRFDRSVDLICGGFPCQPVSVAGKRQAQSDARWLWPEFARILRTLRPRYVLLENVPGLLGSHGGFGDVLGDLAALGYDAEWDCVPAALVGAPHLRYRVFVVAYAKSRIRLRQTPQPTGHASLGGQDVAYADAAGPQGRELLPERAGERTAGASGLADSDTERRDGRPRIFRGGWWRELADCGWWEPEPPVGRLVDGLPFRVDRLKALGNAVVPQVAEAVGRAIMKADKEDRDE